MCSSDRPPAIEQKCPPLKDWKNVPQKTPRDQQPPATAPAHDASNSARYKLIVLWDEHVGKTTLSEMLFHLGFDVGHDDSYSRQSFTVDGVTYDFEPEVLDTSSQDDHSDVPVRAAFLLVYFTSSRLSLFRLGRLYWRIRLSDRYVKGATNHSIFLVGIRGGIDRVSSAEGLKFALRLGVDSFIVCDGSYSGVQSSFLDFIKVLHSRDENSHHGHDSKPGPYWKRGPYGKELVSPTDEGIVSGDQDGLSMRLAGAARANDIQGVRRLLDAGAEVNSQRILYGETQHVVYDKGYPKLTKTLLNRFRRVGRVRSITADVCGLSALHEAAAGGHLEMVKFLLQKGANSNLDSALHGTPLQAAASRGHIRVVEYLLQEGADPNVKAGPFAYPLHAGAWFGSEEVVLALDNGGADISAVDDDRCTALHLAAATGRIEALRVLINWGADISALDNDGCTALHLAAATGGIQALRVLIDRGAESLVNAMTKSAETPVYLVEKGGHSGAVEVLVKFGGRKFVRRSLTLKWLKDQENSNKGSEHRDTDIQFPSGSPDSDTDGGFVDSDPLVIPHPLDAEVEASTTTQSALANRLIKSMLTWAKRRCRRGLRPGHRRLEWTCDCGDDLYADFSAADPEAIARLQKELSPPRAGPSNAPVPVQTTPQPLSLTPTGPAASAGLANTSPSLRSLPTGPDRMTRPGNSGEIGMAPNLRATAMAEPLRPKFLEVCVNTGEFEKRLTEVNMSAVNSDTKLFQDIKEEYQSVRSFRARYFLLKPVDVHFVRFSLENGYRVGIHDKPQSIPDRREMRDHGYGYDPCPMMPMPPVPANIFLHHLLKPEGHPRRVWCGRLPQKLDRSIHQSTRDGDTLVFGWGVHIIEGPHKFNILLTMLIILLSTTVVSVTWAGVREDVQGGFGIGAFLIGARTLILMMVLAKWAET